MAGRNSGGNSVTSSYPSATEYKTTVNVVERVWNVPTDSVPKAGLVIIHGGCWHTGWFGELGDLLSSPDHCIRVSGPDLVAHGMSDDVFPGYRNYCESFDELANEARAAVVRARAALPDGTPIFLLGESMGGLVCLLHLVTHNVDVDGLILCGGLLEIAPALLPPRAVIPVLKAVSYLWPSLAVPGAAIGGESFEGAFGDPAVGPVARADPLVTEMEPPRLGFMTGVMNTMDLVKKESAEKVKVRACPVKLGVPNCNWALTRA